MGSTSKGQAIVNLVQIDPADQFATATAVKDFPDDTYLVMTTKNGHIKKTSLSEFSTPRTNGIIAVSVDSGDILISAGVSDGNNDILLASRTGKSIRFSEDDVRPMGRTARGVKALTLKKDDYLVGMSILHSDEKALLTVTENGFGKQTLLKEYTQQSRGGSGLININVTARNGLVSQIMLLTEDDELLLVSAAGKAIRLKASNLPKYGRNTQGVRIMEWTAMIK